MSIHQSFHNPISALMDSNSSDRTDLHPGSVAPFTLSAAMRIYTARCSGGVTLGHRTSLHRLEQTQTRRIHQAERMSGSTTCCRARAHNRQKHDARGLSLSAHTRSTVFGAVGWRSWISVVVHSTKNRCVLLPNVMRQHRSFENGFCGTSYSRSPLDSSLVQQLMRSWDQSWLSG